MHVQLQLFQRKGTRSATRHEAKIARAAKEHGIIHRQQVRIFRPHGRWLTVVDLTIGPPELGYLVYAVGAHHHVDPFVAARDNEVDWRLRLRGLFVRRFTNLEIERWSRREIAERLDHDARDVAVARGMRQGCHLVSAGWLPCMTSAEPVNDNDI